MKQAYTSKTNLNYCALIRCYTDIERNGNCKSCTNYECAYKKMTDEEIMEVWHEFGNVPVDINENLEYDFFVWKKGTNKYEIWEWFDKKHSKGVGYIMNGMDE